MLVDVKHLISFSQSVNSNCGWEAFSSYYEILNGILKICDLFEHEEWRHSSSTNFMKLVKQHLLGFEEQIYKRYTKILVRKRFYF